VKGTWAFMRGVRAGGADNPFLDQLQIVRAPWFGVYLHVIHRTDEIDPHDHPWAFASLVLDGTYHDLLYPDKRDPGRSFFRARRRFTWARTPLRAAHRVTWTSGPVWTLVFTGPQRNDWGFYKDGEFVPWRVYQEAGS
jgi:hypothetical protein